MPVIRDDQPIGQIIGTVRLDAGSAVIGGVTQSGTWNIGTLSTIAATADPHAVSTWAEKAEAAGETATATKAAAAGQRHYITTAIFSYSDAATGFATVLVNGVEKLKFSVHDQLPVTFPKPYQGGLGESVAIRLAGALVATATVSMTGYTV